MKIYITIYVLSTFYLIFNFEGGLDLKSNFILEFSFFFADVRCVNVNLPSVLRNMLTQLSKYVEYKVSFGFSDITKFAKS